MTASARAQDDYQGAAPRPRRAPDREPDNSGEPANRLRVVLCGSFRRDPEGLRTRFGELLASYDVLSPISLDFVEPAATFVRLPHERTQHESEIEARHLDALVNADFVWLHAPEGYIGTSAAFELGYARSLGIPIFSSDTPAEAMYQPWITVVASPAEVEVRQELCAPGNGLQSLQNYYERAARRRGWAGESAQDTLLLMTEEMGELARAVRKTAGLARHGDWDGQDVGEELADMQLYLVHLANALGIDLAEVVTAKELINARRAAETDVA